MKLGDEQFAQATAWEESGRLALVGIGVEPGLSDVFARYAADHLFSEIDELGTRDSSNLTVDGYEFAPSFSIWTTIEECLGPPLVWGGRGGRGRRLVHHEPFSEPETFDFPEGIGPVECVNVEHEEVVLMPRWVEAKRSAFKYGLGAEFVDVLKTLHKLGLDRTEKVQVGGVEVSPRDGRRPACRTRRRWATGCTARRAPACGSPAPARTTAPGRRTSTTSWTTRGPWRSTATGASSGRPR